MMANRLCKMLVKTGQNHKTPNTIVILLHNIAMLVVDYDQQIPEVFPESIF
jgi:hypothetical protein